MRWIILISSLGILSCGTKPQIERAKIVVNLAD